MGKRLAIRGHSTRGNEVIEILEMMGGKNNCDSPADNLGLCYLFDDEFDICAHYFGYDDYEDGELNIFTLEEFLEKYPFKVGDKVEVCGTDKVFTIGNMMWEEELCTVHYANMEDFEYYTAKELKLYKETNMNENKFGTAKKPLESKSNAVKLVDDKVVDNLDKGKTMNKKLAIKGHPTRGKEVIELLTMMGGRDVGVLKGNHDYYVIDECENNLIKFYGHNYIRCHEFVVFTLEEFLEKYPFKVGDKVVYTKYGDNCDDYPVTIESMKWTGTTIEYTFDDCVTCLAKDLKKWNGESNEVISGIYLNSYEYADEVELNLGDYEIEVRDGRTFAVKKKPKYPKTYAECCEILVGRKPNPYEISFDKMELCLVDLDHTQNIDFQNPQLFQLNGLFRLLMCRNAYWKIAGEQMGLDKPWNPNWVDAREVKYSIVTVCGSIDYYTSIEQRENRILVFPTDEMRTEFYYNFKDLIESCKELL